MKTLLSLFFKKTFFVVQSCWLFFLGKRQLHQQVLVIFGRKGIIQTGGRRMLRDYLFTCLSSVFSPCRTRNVIQFMWSTCVTTKAHPQARYLYSIYNKNVCPRSQKILRHKRGRAQDREDEVSSCCCLPFWWPGMWSCALSARSPEVMAACAVPVWTWMSQVLLGKSGSTGWFFSVKTIRIVIKISEIWGYFSECIKTF